MPEEFFTEEELYKKVPIRKLIILGIYLLEKKDKKGSFEDLTRECFKSFPKTFSLSGYPDWPDTRRLDRPLRTLRNEHLIKGDPKTSFSLTAKGKKEALEIIKTFKQRKLL